MGTKIEWTDESWNPVVGCTKVSEGCQNCYAEKMAARLASMGHEKYIKVTSYFDGKSWNNEVFCDNSVLDKPLHWEKARRIFVVSMGDLFHPAVPFSYIDKVVDVAEKCPQHMLQFLTKRASIMYDYSKYRNFKWPENIIGMVTAENQVRVDWCIPYLLQCGFKTTGVSCEPLLGEIDIRKYLQPVIYGSRCMRYTGKDFEEIPLIHQVIIGCESINGKIGRFCEDEQKWWAAARNITRQVKTAGGRLFMKQGPINGKVSKNMSEWPQDLRLREVSK